MSDFDQYLTKHIEGIKGRYSAHEQAEQFLGWMKRHHRDVLDAWLNERALRLVSDAISRRSNSERAKARHRAQPRAFAEAVEAAAAGDSSKLEGFVSIWDVEHVVDDEATRARASEMTGPEHEYVAKRYRSTERQVSMLAAFHAAVAKRVGGRRTSEVIDRDEYERMFQSITGQAA